MSISSVYGRLILYVYRNQPSENESYFEIAIVWLDLFMGLLIRKHENQENGGFVLADGAKIKLVSAYSKKIYQLKKVLVLEK